MIFFIILFLCTRIYQSINIIEEEVNTALYLSSQAYCNKDHYLTMPVPPDFKIETIIEDKVTDMQGFIGHNNNSMYIILRGSSSIRNWIEDLDAIHTEYPYCEQCKVHKGFYRTSENIKNHVIQALSRERFSNQFINIILSGHSYGAAISVLLSLELLQHEIPNKVYNFGQPRIGNKEFSEYVNQKIPTYYRFTHNRDIVPHVPPIHMGYYHSHGEIFEDSNSNIIKCSDSEGEDPECSLQYKLRETNIDDHMVYLDYNIECLD